MPSEPVEPTRDVLRDGLGGVGGELEGALADAPDEAQPVSRLDALLQT